jgi:hypothetical protein
VLKLPMSHRQAVGKLSVVLKTRIDVRAYCCSCCDARFLLHSAHKRLHDRGCCCARAGVPLRLPARGGFV